MVGFFTPDVFANQEIQEEINQQEIVRVHLFYVYWCPVYDAAKELLIELRERYPDFEVTYYSLYVAENIDIFSRLKLGKRIFFVLEKN